MEYKGKLYGRLGDSYTALTQTTDDWEALEQKVKELENKITSYRSEILNDRFTIEELQKTVEALESQLREQPMEAIAQDLIDTMDFFDTQRTTVRMAQLKNGNIAQVQIIVTANVEEFL